MYCKILKIILILLGRSEIFRIGKKIKKIVDEDKIDPFVAAKAC